MKLIRHILFSFFSLTTVILITSCGNPSSTNWLFVNQTEVDKLLNSPEEIEFDGEKYILDIYFFNGTYRSSRGCPLFLCGSTVINPKSVVFILNNSNKNSLNKNFNKEIKAVNLWIINRSSNYYYETKDITRRFYEEDLFTSYSINPPVDYKTESENIGIIKFEIGNKVFYIKSKIYSR